MKRSLFEELQVRGLIHQQTDASLEKYAQKNPISLYSGFDPSSNSIHIGNLVGLLNLRRFQLAGHRPIALVGGATGMIGDPSGKSQERTLLSSEQLEKNVQGMKKILAKFLDFDGKKGAKLLNNADWFKNYGYLDFLREVGKHFTVNYMMAKDSVKSRLHDREHGISYTEFSYMLLQAYDFYVLHREENCTLQIGGSDQWGNITAGCELIRRMGAAQGKKESVAFGQTHPLVTKADGSKFGKTESGTIWLDSEKTSAYQFYQFFLRTSDTDVISYLKYFTFLDLEEIQALEHLLKKEPEKREAQKKLASEVCTLVHGKSETEKAEKASLALFGTEIKDLDQRAILEIFSDAPSTTKPRSLLSSGLLLIDLLADGTLSKSKGAARKDIQGGGIYLNNERVSDVQAKVKQSDLIADRYLVLRKGKRNYYLIDFKN